MQYAERFCTSKVRPNVWSDFIGKPYVDDDADFDVPLAEGFKLVKRSNEDFEVVEISRISPLPPIQRVTSESEDKTVSLNRKTEATEGSRTKLSPVTWKAEDTLELRSRAPDVKRARLLAAGRGGKTSGSNDSNTTKATVALEEVESKRPDCGCIFV